MTTSDAFLPEPNPADAEFEPDIDEPEIDDEEDEFESEASDDDAVFRTPEPGHRLTASELESDLDE